MMRGRSDAVRWVPGAPVPSGALRAVLASGSAVGVAAIAHMIGHGTVGVPALVLAFVMLLGPAWLLTRRERSFGAHALTQLAGQQAVHLALTATAGHTGHVAGDLMLYAHLAAAALTGGWLRWGERRAWSALRRLIAVPLLVPMPLLPAAPQVLAAPLPPRRLHAALLRHALDRRGPPALAA
jgi:hypothetical protein